MKNKDIKYKHQRTGYYCGPASLQMAFSFFKKSITQDNLAKKAKTNTQRGTTTEKMTKTALGFGFHVYVNTQSTLEEIKFFLSLEKPVIVDFIEPSSNEGHYSLISGITKNKIILHDPWNGDQFSLPLDGFIGRWRDGYSNHPHWMMVISEEPFSLGKQYHPKKENKSSRRHL